MKGTYLSTEKSRNLRHYKTIKNDDMGEQELYIEVRGRYSFCVNINKGNLLKTYTCIELSTIVEKWEKKEIEYTTFQKKLNEYLHLVQPRCKVTIVNK
jgi:hypothetical protein